MEVLGLNPFAQAASGFIFLPEYERVPECIEAIGALNRWPRRTGVPIEEYLNQWEASCIELRASTYLPKRLKEILHIASERSGWLKISVELILLTPSWAFAVQWRAAS